MVRKINKFMLVMLFTVLSGCDVIGGTAHRSGTLDNDYKEDPVPQHYANALTLSNYVVKTLIAGQYLFIAENYVDSNFSDHLDEIEIKRLYVQVRKIYGNPKSYMDNQWGFVTRNVEGKKLLFSVKIVEHENRTLHYIITFINDGQFRKMIGISVKERVGVRNPAEL